MFINQFDLDIPVVRTAPSISSSAKQIITCFTGTLNLQLDFKVPIEMDMTESEQNQCNHE